MSRLETRYSKFSSFEDRGSSRVVRVSSDCQLTFDRYCISLSCNDKLPGKNDKGENDISLGASDKSLDANDISLGANDKSLDGNNKSLGANDKSLGANDKSVRANDISLRTNDISLGANDKSHRTHRDIVIVKTIAPRYLVRYCFKLIIVQILPINRNYHDIR